MSDLISIKIDVTKILKEKLFPGKSGAKYLDAVLIPSANSQYGDSHMIVQSVSKEERLAGKKGPIIGNAKIIGAAKRTEASPPSYATTTHINTSAQEDVPF